MIRDILIDKMRGEEERKKGQNRALVWGVIVLISTVFAIGFLIDATLSIVADRFHNEEVVNIERIVMQTKIGEPIKLVTFFTDSSRITIWARKDSLQIDKMRFE